MFTPDAASCGRQFLSAHGWFNQLDPDTQGRVADGVTLLSRAKGETLLHAGEPVLGWYAVLRGLAKLQSESPQGRLSVFLGARSGDWFGEGSALKTEPRRYDVVALRDTTLLCLPRPLFDELRHGNLAFSQFLVERLNLRLGQAMAMIEAERIRSPQQRVALYLGSLFWPGQRRLSISQEELAQLVGLSRQTVNRVLRAMQERGLVSLEFGRIGILDEAALASLPLQDPCGLK